MTGKWTPGGKTKTKEAARATGLFPYEYECVRERDVPEKVTPVTKSADDTFPEHRFIYFKYASDEVNKALTPQSELDSLAALMAADYKVVNVQAFTSPEGLRDPSPQWKEGNKGLSGRRAAKAKELAEAACKNGSCITGGITPPKDVELLPLDFENLDGTTSEGKGKALEDEVVDAWDRGDSEDIKEQKTEAAEKRVKAARPPRQGRGHLPVSAPLADRPRQDRAPRVGRERHDARERRPPGRQLPARDPRGGPQRLAGRRPGRLRRGRAARRLPYDRREMLSITTKSPYALRALAELARAGGDGPGPDRRLARRRDIPVEFLEQLFAVLLLAAASCAPSAASRAATPSPASPSDITVLEIVEMLDGKLGAARRAIFGEAAEAARAVLAASTIADVVERENREAGATNVLHLSRGMDRFTGGCLCGNVRIVASGPPYRVGICHCLDCRKHHGALFQRVRGVPSGCGDDRGRDTRLPRAVLLSPLRLLRLRAHRRRDRSAPGSAGCP